MIAIVVLEACSSVSMRWLFIFRGTLSPMLICIFVFFVRESLILLASLLSSIRRAGVSRIGVIVS